LEFGIPTRQARLIKMCPNGTYSTVRLGKYLSDALHTNNGLKQEEAIMPLYFNFAL